MPTVQQKINDTLTKIHKSNPDLRIGQIIYNALMRESGGVIHHALFYVDNQDMLDCILKYENYLKDNIHNECKRSR